MSDRYRIVSNDSGDYFYNPCGLEEAWDEEGQWADVTPEWAVYIGGYPRGVTFSGPDLD